MSFSEFSLPSKPEGWKSPHVASSELLVPPNPETAILTPSEFVNEVIDLSKSVDSRLWVKTMHMPVQDENVDLYLALASCARRGKDVRLAIDDYTNYHLAGDRHMLAPRWKLHLTDKEKAQDTKNKRMFSHLTASGVRFIINNQMNILNQAAGWVGRDHSKVALADDDLAYSLHFNLYKSDFESYNFAIRMSGQAANKILEEYFLKTSQPGRFKDYFRWLNGQYVFVFDGGLNGSSLIQELALQHMILSEKEEIIWPTQFTPSGKVAEALLHQAARGTRVTTIESDRGDGLVQSYFNRINEDKFQEKASSVPNLRRAFIKGKVHEKTLYTRTHGILATSHNLKDEGVYAGTEEHALWSCDPVLVEQVYKSHQAAIQSVL